jgi:hypothetical protein
MTAPSGRWEITLIYEDIFGNTFHTRHSKSPEQPWINRGRGAS